MFDLLRRVFESGFFRDNSLLFFAALATGALNYLYYPVLGRMLTPAAFGEVQTLVSLFLQLAAFLSGLSVLGVTLVANAKNEQETQKVVLEFERLALVASGVLVLGSLVLSPLLQQFFHFETAWPFALLALALAVSVPFTFRGAYLRGKKQFGHGAAGHIVAALGKLVLSVVLVAIGLGTLGAMLGILGAQLLGLAYVAYWALRYGLARRKIGWPSIKRLRPHAKYAGAVLLVSSVMTLQYSIDIVLVKHFFEPHAAGLYAGVATVARIIFFLTASIAQVMLASVVVGNAQNGALLKKSLLLFVLVSTPVLLLCVLAPGFVMQLLMGAAYNAYAWLLPPLATAMTVIALLQLLTSYFIAQRLYAVVGVAAFGGGLTLWLMVAGRQSLEAVVSGLLIGSFAMLGLLAAWYFARKLQMRYI